jgi:hypothetical protein
VPGGWLFKVRALLSLQYSIYNIVLYLQYSTILVRALLYLLHLGRGLSRVVERVVRHLIFSFFLYYTCAWSVALSSLAAAPLDSRSDSAKWSCEACRVWAEKKKKREKRA